MLLAIRQHASGLLRAHRQHAYRVYRHANTSAAAAKTLAIRREDNTVWERRAPLSPANIRKLVADGYNVLVQPSNRRAYAMQEYISNGAQVVEDLSEASVILGVKQVPIDLLIPNKTYVFFSHTIKAQEANMPLLDAILEKKIRLIDYEKMTDSSGRRVVAFGKYAGVTGMINILHGLGLRLLALGHHTPFMHIGPAHNYRNSEMARQAVRDAGYEIALGMMPRSIGPLTFVFTGTGNVSQGAQEVFRELPFEYTSPEHLPSVVKHGSTNKIYACVVDVEDHIVHKDGSGPGTFQAFTENPDDYVSIFHRKIAPYMSVLINGIYWGPGHPRLITIPEAKSLLHPQPMPWLPSSEGCPHLPHRLTAICDISADVGGSIEFMRRCTSIDHPFMLYDAHQNTETENFEGNGVLLCSIDNMPAQIPKESTDFFGSMLMPHMPEIMLSDSSTPFEQYNVSPLIKDSVIASNGKLTPQFQYIRELRQQMKETNRGSKSAALSPSNHKVLVLGSGYVSAPLVDYLTRSGDTHVTVASQMQDEIDGLANRYPNVTPVLTEMQRSQDDIEALIKSHDVVVSLLPYSLHSTVAKMCIRNQTNMVTASYRVPEMEALHQQAVDAGITVVNEVGVDPGIDHLLAMKCFDELTERGAKIKSFVSYCGGLSAPEYSNNPLRYKFNWSPRGVILNVLSPARWLEGGSVREIQPGGSLLDNMQEMDFLPGFNLEGFPNRDSTIYSSLYGINTAQTIKRGTLRYKGFASAMKGLLALGFVDPNSHALLHPNGPDLTWREYMCEVLGQKRDLFHSSLLDLVHEKVGRDAHQFGVIQDLGLLDDELIDKRGSPLDTLSNYLSKRLAYQPGERDLLIMRHDVGVEWPDHSTQTHHVDFVVYGNEDGYSAMAATVGYPAAIATKMVLCGEIQKKGMILPFDREIYMPMIHRLEALGLVAKEYTSTDREV